MLIGSRQRVADKALRVSVGGNVLTQVNSVRYLGALIDPALSWTAWSLESHLDLLQLFVMGHCHLQCCVYYTQPL